MSDSGPIYVTAREAAAELNVSRATLYAYVSRGMIESIARPGQRGRVYALNDIRALRGGRTESSGGGAKAGLLDFGAPVMESRLTAIWRDRLYYRGRDAVALARTASFETVASLLWDVSDVDPFAACPPCGPDDAVPGEGIAAAIQRLTRAALRDPSAHARQKDRIAGTGAGIVGIIASSFGALGVGPIAARLAAGWRRPDAAPAIQAALILTADHELNSSAFVVRCVASTRATPHNAVIAGLTALQGPRHGGQTLQVAAMLEEVARAPTPEQGITDRVARGDRLPGFGHPLYQAGDVRATAVLEALDRAAADPGELDLIRRVAAAVFEMTGEYPNIDLSLVALARAFALPPLAPLGVFATGRCAGWIAHAQEQYADGRLIRPRARYVGEEPRTAHGNRVD